MKNCFKDWSQSADGRATYGPRHKFSFCFVLFGLALYVPVNSYVDVGTVSSPTALPANSDNAVMISC